MGWGRKMYTMAKQKRSFEEQYPELAYYAESMGTVEIGEDYNYDSLVRLIDTGGLRWEDNGKMTMDEALAAAEAFCKAEFGGDGY